MQLRILVFPPIIDEKIVEDKVNFTILVIYYYNEVEPLINAIK